MTLYLNFLQLFRLVYEKGDKKSKTSYFFYLKQTWVFKSLFKIYELRYARITWEL